MNHKDLPSNEQELNHLKQRVLNHLKLNGTYDKLRRQFASKILEGSNGKQFHERAYQEARNLKRHFRFDKHEQLSDKEKLRAFKKIRNKLKRGDGVSRYLRNEIWHNLQSPEAMNVLRADIENALEQLQQKYHNTSAETLEFLKTGSHIENSQTQQQVPQGSSDQIKKEESLFKTEDMVEKNLNSTLRQDTLLELQQKPHNAGSQKTKIENSESQQKQEASLDQAKNEEAPMKTEDAIKKTKALDEITQKQQQSNSLDE